MIDLKVWPAQVADGNDPTLTPGKGPKGNRMYRLKKVQKYKYSDRYICRTNKYMCV